MAKKKGPYERPLSKLQALANKRGMKSQHRKKGELIQALEEEDQKGRRYLNWDPDYLRTTFSNRIGSSKGLSAAKMAAKLAEDDRKQGRGYMEFEVETDGDNSDEVDADEDGEDGEDGNDGDDGEDDDGGDGGDGVGGVDDGDINADGRSVGNLTRRDSMPRPAVVQVAPNVEIPIGQPAEVDQQQLAGKDSRRSTSQPYSRESTHLTSNSPGAFSRSLTEQTGLTSPSKTTPELSATPPQSRVSQKNRDKPASRESSFSAQPPRRPSLSERPEETLLEPGQSNQRAELGTRGEHQGKGMGLFQGAVDKASNIFKRAPEAPRTPTGAESSKRQASRTPEVSDEGRHRSKGQKGVSFDNPDNSSVDMAPIAYDQSAEQAALTANKAREELEEMGRNENTAKDLLEKLKQSAANADGDIQALTKAQIDIWNSLCNARDILDRLSSQRSTARACGTSTGVMKAVRAIEGYISKARQSCEKLQSWSKEGEQLVTRARKSHMDRLQQDLEDKEEQILEKKYKLIDVAEELEDAEGRVATAQEDVNINNKNRDKLKS